MFSSKCKADDLKFLIDNHEKHKTDKKHSFVAVEVLYRVKKSVLTESPFFFSKVLALAPAKGCENWHTIRRHTQHIYLFIDNLLIDNRLEPNHETLNFPEVCIRAKLKVLQTRMLQNFEFGRIENNLKPMGLTKREAFDILELPYGMISSYDWFFRFLRESFFNLRRI